MGSAIRAALQMAQQFQVTVEFSHNDREIRVEAEDTLKFIEYRLKYGPVAK